MLDKVKLALRLSGTALDGEVSDLINAAIADLRLVGINIPAEAGSSSKTLGDPLLDRAVVLYAKAEFGFNDDAERYRNAYDYLKCALSLTADYIESGWRRNEMARTNNLDRAIRSFAVNERTRLPLSPALKPRQRFLLTRNPWAFRSSTKRNRRDIQRN